MANAIAATPEPPYYAVVFTTQRTMVDGEQYAAAAAKMIELARQQPGFLGYESVRDDSGMGVTISYWRDRESIDRWRANADHMAAQSLGRQRWYQQYRLRVCRVEREYGYALKTS